MEPTPRPRTNSKAERFIQRPLREWAYASVYQTSNERQADLPIYPTRYNEHRNHRSLGYRAPVSRILGAKNVHGINN